ncbi:Hypothetical protein A7982_01974 [Minicystis rosea]|nr:Hypothetical protein A7982_01974 [Minicystis rosea]
MASEDGLPEAIRIRSVGPVSGAAVAWRAQGRVRLTIIAKTTLLMAPGEPMVLAEPEPIFRTDQNHRDDPKLSVRLPREAAPYLPHADVMLTGHACAPEGSQATALAVRFAVYRGDALLDKTIHVYGDRKSGSDPAPFERIPLMYERAYGGPAFDDNPLGTGHEGRGKAPNLIHPADPAFPACFAPISRIWPARRRLLGKLDRKQLDLPIAEIPDGFDWTYFNAAPMDQRTAHLQGDEWVVLEGMHPVHQGIQSRLPDVRAMARVFGIADGGGGHRVPLVADMMHIDADDLVCTLVFRQSFPLPSVEALAAVRIDVGVEASGQSIEWPAPPAPPSAAVSAPVSAPSESEPKPRIEAPAPMAEATPSSKWEGTMAIPADGAPVASTRKPLPFVPKPEGAADPAPAAPARVDVAPAPAESASSKWEGTMAIAADSAPAASTRKPLPFVPKPEGAADAARADAARADAAPARVDVAPASVRSAPAQSTSSNWEGTLDLSGSVPVAATGKPMPFAPRPDGSVAEPAVSEMPIEPAAPSPGRARTVSLSLGEDEIANVRSLPFVPGQAVLPPSAPLPPRPTRSDGSKGPLDGTVTLTERTLQTRPRPLPFGKRAPAQDPLPSAPIDVPSAVPAVTSIEPEPPPARPKPSPRASNTALGIELFHEGPLSIGVVPWGIVPSRDCITVIAKATCDLAADGPAVLRPRAEPLSTELRAEHEVPARLVHPSDLVPFKVRADVVLVGHAHAPKGSAPSADLAFRFGRSAGGFERRLRVFGDRRWKRDGAALRPADPAPFARIPVAYERAYGGPRFSANPVGLGHPEPLRSMPSGPPNLEDPDRLLLSAKQPSRPACFAPMPLAWKASSSRRDGALCLAEELDWMRFQAAPRAQQLAFLRGDEPFEIEGMHPKHASIKGTLPGVRARCFAAFRPEAGGRFDEIVLHLDTVVIDADAMTMSLVWRGAVPVPDEQKPPITSLHWITENAAEPGISVEEARATLLRPRA